MKEEYSEVSASVRMSEKEMPETVEALRKYGEHSLKDARIPDASLDACLLLEHVTGISRAGMYAYPERKVPAEQAKAYQKLILQRAAHVPLQYLTGKAYFMGHEFTVRPGVLIPRQDTECLAEEALACIEDISTPRILDLCTGSGCILFSLCMERSDAVGVGVDISEAALCTARENLPAGGHIRLIRGDVLNTPSYTAFMPEGADLIVSNPPYIVSEEIEHLAEEVKGKEPRLALDGGADGLDFYRKIVPASFDALTRGGWLLCEIGWDEGAAVKELYLASGFSGVEVRKDYAGLDRVVKGRKL